MKAFLIFLVRLYRRFLSPGFGRKCRFTPSCSAYAIEALERYGAFLGLGMILWRILRCNPFGKGGDDPVL